MSKLAKLIDATMTGDARGARELHPRYIDVTTSVSNEPPLGFMSYTYTLGVSLRKVAVVRENIPIKEALRDVKRAMIEEVFGEFRRRCAIPAGRRPSRESRRRRGRQSPCRRFSPPSAGFRLRCAESRERSSRHRL